MCIFITPIAVIEETERLQVRGPVRGRHVDLDRDPRVQDGTGTLGDSRKQRQRVLAGHNVGGRVGVGPDLDVEVLGSNPGLGSDYHG